ncbi:MAG: serine hydrolase [Patescibacteria group bacterium]
MLSALLLILVQLHRIDAPVSFIQQLPMSTQAAYATQLLQDGYPGAFRVTRPLPPLRTDFFVNSTVPITARSAVVLDAQSGAVLWFRQPDLVRPIASLTKLMTALVFLEQGVSFDTEVTIESSDNEGTEGSRLLVEAGERLTARDLFYASLVGSANNATRALARASGLTPEAFASRMNELAVTLGAPHTHYAEVTGLDPANVSTALDYSRIASYAFRNETVRQALATPEYTFETADQHVRHRIRSTDELLADQTIGIVAAKTGYLDEAGYTFACQAAGTGSLVTVVLLGSDTSQARFTESAALIRWVDSAYRWY